MKIILFGDSTIATYGLEHYPQTGWGQIFPRFLKKEIEVLNFGKNGRSTKSFYQEGLLDKALSYLNSGDYAFIQFGHNDQKADLSRHTEAASSYRDYLKIYLSKIKAKGGIPILLSSVCRRHFDENGSLKEKIHGDYPQAMAALAVKEEVVFLDIFQLTANELQSRGDENSKELYMNFEAGTYPNYPEGCHDDTHLSYRGAYWVSKLVIEALIIKNLFLEFIL